MTSRLGHGPGETARLGDEGVTSPAGVKDFCQGPIVCAHGRPAEMHGEHIDGLRARVMRGLVNSCQVPMQPGRNL
jgi:hypothetical protein